jgi:hypothetical protein
MERRRAAIPVKRWTIVVVALVVAGAGALLYAMGTNYEVLEEGKLLPYSDGYVYRVRFFGFLEVYAEPSRRPDIPDVVTSFALMMLSGVALVTALALRTLASRASLPAARFFLLTAFGGAWFGADELLGLHESIGHNLRFLADLPGIVRPDDVIILVYGLVALGVLVAFRHVVLSSRSARPFFVAMCCAVLLVPVFDITGSGLEEAAEISAAAAMLAAFVVLAIDYLVLRAEGAARRNSARAGSG